MSRPKWYNLKFKPNKIWLNIFALDDNIKQQLTPHLECLHLGLYDR